MPVQVELAVHDLAGIQLAAHLGPDRIELCTGLALGGLTPSAGLVEAAVAERERGGPRVHVLIRPRTGGFFYHPDEIALMRSDIARAVAQGVDGVVIGAARQDDDGGTRLDLEAIAELRAAADSVRAATGSAEAAAGSVRVALHRVIDTVSDPVAAVRELHGTGVDLVLTSGGAAKAPEASGTLRQMAREGGEEIQIMAGSGVRAPVVPQLAATGIAAVHGSAGRRGPAEVGDVLGASAEAARRLHTDPEVAADLIAAARRVRR